LQHWDSNQRKARSVPACSAGRGRDILC
jgi:hypothetical protein